MTTTYNITLDKDKDFPKPIEKELSDIYERCGGLLFSVRFYTTTKSKSFSNQVRRFYSILKESKFESEYPIFNALQDIGMERCNTYVIKSRRASYKC